MYLNKKVSQTLNTALNFNISYIINNIDIPNFGPVVSKVLLAAESEGSIWSLNLNGSWH